MTTEPTCRLCGCTEDHACIDAERGACSWAEPDLCSHCADSTDLLRQLVAGEGDRIDPPKPGEVFDDEVFLALHHATQLLKILTWCDRRLPVFAASVEGADSWATADFWYSAIDPDDNSTDTPFNILHEQGYHVITEVKASTGAGTRWGFLLPAAEGADNDDDREFWFDNAADAQRALAEAHAPAGTGPAPAS